MVLLRTSDVKGACFVETKNLDGETNLKIKQANKDIYPLFQSNESLSRLDGRILCEKPNNAIYKFEGFAELQGYGLNEKISLNADNVLLRGMSVRNTEFVYGVTVFTGHDTKVMMNSANSKYKFSRLELLSNFSIIIIFCT
jgi:magnesium-transporting ATPase (P-type)